MEVLSASNLKAFHLSGLTGSFKHAAHLLSVSPSTVSARVRSLEKALGVRLFDRGVRNLNLTEAGADYLREVAATFVSLDIATRELRLRFGAQAVARPVGKQRTVTPPSLRRAAEHGVLLGADWA